MDDLNIVTTNSFEALAIPIRFLMLLGGCRPQESLDLTTTGLVVRVWALWAPQEPAVMSRLLASSSDWSVVIVTSFIFSNTNRHTNRRPVVAKKANDLNFDHGGAVVGGHRF